jgi:hypothetical protein
MGRLGVAPTVAFVVVGAVATSASGGSHSSQAILDEPKREIVEAVFHLTPARRLASISRFFVHADVGMEAFRLVVPRGLHVELLSRNPVLSASGQPASKMLCTPYRLCRDPGRTHLQYCRNAGPKTICSYATEARPIYPQGRWVLTVREFDPRRARVTLRVVFVRGPGA